MFFRKKKDQKTVETKRTVSIKRHVADSIITYAKSCHPNEGILILQGQSKKNSIVVDGLVMPPFASHGPY
ncbi:MAG: peptidase, partial [Thermoproteota archaeon]|nr:peptidase [Thermoproteota archaeon]